MRDPEYNVPVPRSCQGVDSLAPTVNATDKLSNVVKALTPPGEGTIVLVACASWACSR